MDWNCANTEERLSDILDAALAAPESSAFSAHAAGCARCRGLVARVGKVVQRIHELPMIEEPPFLAARIIATTRASSAQESSPRGWLAWLPAISPARLAMGSLTVAASFFFVFHAAGALPRRVPFSPANIVYSANRHVHLTYARGVKFVNDMRVVYVIQSRLFSEPQPPSEPAPTPAPRPNASPEQHAPDSQARPKSQAAPPSSDRTWQTTSELAKLTVPGQLTSPLNEEPRS